MNDVMKSNNVEYDWTMENPSILMIKQSLVQISLKSKQWTRRSLIFLVSFEEENFA